ncbi:probable DNA-directed RNA polymerase II chain Rpb7 [Ustilago trichophora]|uniref:Probable DNA-directed RNA polymerase II chain Rpb7 n=1 Tax=Ustilago trichophora TaxID=86804 RepID=A0A5C3EGT3_9BASI|nr:probable DNA-directed RNA polymerase II chain Rpb7 [Ustilago trichophora]
MFFLKYLTHKTELHPSYFGPSMVEFLNQKLRDDVEGTCTGKHGYIIKVVGMIDVGQGKVIPGSGLAEFNSTYQAVVLKPFKGEVMDAKITNVNKMGFFAEVGPLNIFVSSHLIPIEYKFQPESNPPEFVSPSDRLVKARKVRIKIVGTRVDANEIFAIGTMKEDYLGPFD